MSPLEKLIMKKKESGSMMDPMEQKAKMSNLEALRDEMSGMMKGDLQPKAKVEIASDSPEGIVEGLDKAKDVMTDIDMSSEKPEIEEIGEPLEIEKVEDSELSPEEMAMLKKLLSRVKGI